MKEKRVYFGKNKKVAGILNVPNIKNPPAVIILHGYGGFILAERFERMSANLCENGYAVLQVIFRGYDAFTGYKSKKEFRKLRISGEISDLKASIDFLYKKGYRKIGIAAECFGGIIAILLSDPRIGALALWSINTQNKATFEKLYGEKIVKDLEEKGHADYISHTTGEKFAINRDFWEDVKDNRVISEDKIKNLKYPLLIVYGDGDKFFEGESSKNMYKTANEPKKLVFVKGANHIFSNNPEYLNKLINSVTEWFNKWLK